MKQTIVIAPITREKGTTQILSGKYTHPTIGIVNILTNGKVVGHHSKDAERTKDILITDANPEFVFSWDDKNEEKVLEAKAWKQNPTVDNPENKNLVRAMFRMVDKTDQTKRDVMLQKQK